MSPSDDKGAAHEPLPLFVRELGAPDAPVLVILHGLLGTGDNWQTLAKSYAQTHRVLLVDARNHGRSPHDPVHTYAAMAEDVRGLLDAHGIQKAALLGHSMGGKTVLEFARRHPDRCEQLIIADMAARAYPIHHDAIFQALRSAPLGADVGREDVTAHLLAALGDRAIVAFLMKGLRRGKPGEAVPWSWRPNLPVLHAALPEVVRAVGLEMSTLPTLAVYGGNSSYVGASDLAQFEDQFLQFEAHCIPDVGHWLHAEAPDAFLEVTRDFLD